jgi:hypothetical protein
MVHRVSEQKTKFVVDDSAFLVSSRVGGKKYSGFFSLPATFFLKFVVTATTFDIKYAIIVAIEKQSLSKPYGCATSGSILSPFEQISCCL